MTQAEKKHSIIIDKKEYHTEADRLTGAQLRQLAQPPISSDYDLFQIVPGGVDEMVPDDAEVAMKSGERFFSAPRNITPGR